ncbi:MAG: NAD(P)H-binding protein [Pseudomonadales bacterium]
MNNGHIKKLLLLGATGRAGRQLLKLCLEKDYAVTALVRTPEKLDIVEHPGLTVIKGDLSQKTTLSILEQDKYDGVLSTLGIFNKSPGTPLTALTAGLIHSLRHQQNTPLIFMSSLGVGDSKKLGNVLVRMVTSITLRHVLPDKEQQEQLLRISGHPYAIIRPPQLVSSEASETYQRWQGHDTPGKLRWKISTTDAAKEMLWALEHPEQYNKSWQISY